METIPLSEANFQPWLERLMDERMVPPDPNVQKYSADQPRDERGRWTSGGGSAVEPWKTDTLDSQTYYKGATGHYDAARTALHEQMLAGIFAGKTPVDHPVVTILGGGPASGKSTIVDSGLLGIPANSVYVNPDDIKTQLPEYKAMVDEGLGTKASAFVHEEGSEVSKIALGRAIAGKYNTVYDTTGDSSLKSVVGKVEAMRAAGATINADYVTCDTETAWQRALGREQATGRGVPESYLRATHASVSEIVPLGIDARLWDNFRLWDTNGSQPVLVASYADKGPLTIHDQAACDAFVAKAKG